MRTCGGKCNGLFSYRRFLFIYLHTSHRLCVFDDMSICVLWQCGIFIWIWAPWYVALDLRLTWFFVTWANGSHQIRKLVIKLTPIK